ncbi:MAG: SPOR domain-containing protein [Acidobacteriota bacterium]
MSPVDSGFPRDPGEKRRMLPSVTDVVRELAKVVSADPAVLFKGARSVVAEELAKVKQGFEAAPLDVLVKRARHQLERDGEATPVSDAPPPMPTFPARPAPARATPPRPASRPGIAARTRPGTDDPFQDVASRAELNWEKEIPIQPEDAPFRSAILPIPHKARGPLEISQPIDAPAKAAPEPKPPPAPKPQSELDLDFASPTPPAPERPAPKAKPSSREPVSTAAETTGPNPRSAPPEPPSAASGPPVPKSRVSSPEHAAEELMPRPAVVSAPAVPLVNPRDAEAPEAAFRGAAPSPPVPRSPVVPLPPPPPGGPDRFLRTPSPPARHEPAVTPTSEMPPRDEILEDSDGTQPVMEEFRFKEAERPAAAPASTRSRSSRKGWLVALVSVLVVGAGLTWAVREYVFKSDILRSPAPAAKKPDVAPVESAVPASAPTAPPPALGKPAAPPPKAVPVPAKQPAGPPGVAIPKGRAAVLLTPDWAGKPIVYVIHFSSTKDRAGAEKEAQKLAASLGAPAHAVEVDLGEKGIWYRVVVGEFKDVEDARAFRAELEAKKTPGMGFVYEMRGR